MFKFMQCPFAQQNVLALVMYIFEHSLRARELDQRLQICLETLSAQVAAAQLAPRLPDQLVLVARLRAGSISRDNVKKGLHVKLLAHDC